MQVRSPSPSHIRGSLTDNRSVYILVVPLDAPASGSVIPLDAHPARAHMGTGTSGQGSPSSPAFWGVFHVESLAPAQLSGPHTKLNILRADRVSTGNLPAYVREVERRSDPRINPESKQPHARWIWADTRTIAPILLRKGVRVQLCHDMRLVQRILRTASTHPSGHVRYDPVLDLAQDTVEKPAGKLPVARQIAGQGELFGEDFLTAAEENTVSGHEAAPPTLTSADTELVHRHLDEFTAQLRAIATGAHPERLRLLAAAESAGSLVAAEIEYYGIPFDTDAHDAHLTEILGPRPPEGEHPAKLMELAEQIRADLFAPHLNPDSPQELLRALHAAGVNVPSTRSYVLKGWAEETATQRERRWALIEPILRYKKLYRIFTANGWSWADSWVRNGRFRPHLEVGGAATGRWGASGGGALQLPAEIRSAILAPEGEVFLVSDGSQIEPRILAALSHDEALASAGRGTDMYAGIAELARLEGVALTERAQAKVGLLAIMYGGRSGEIGALLPHVAKLFPRAMEFTERAARIGEVGGQVTTFLGRTSPAPDERFKRTVADRSTPAAESRAVSLSRSYGRMTRNFVVQGTAAEWALCWMGRVRSRLLTETVFGMPMRTKIVYFLHDELLLCGPKLEAERVERILRESAAEAARLLFGTVPVEFPVSVTVTTNYAEGK